MLEEEKKVIIQKLADPSSRKFINLDVVRVAKDDQISELIRSEGNVAFKNKRFHNAKVHEFIWMKYCLSIAVAVKGSEMQALGFCNRSVFLLHLSKFEESIQDIDRAYNITNSTKLKVKLLCRKVECLLALNEPGIEKSLEEAKYCLTQLGKSKDKTLLKNLIKRTEDHLKKRNPEEKKKIDRTSKAIEIEQNVNDFSSVAIKYDAKFRNNLVTTRDIKPGEVIFVEKPYVATLNLERAHAYCSHCFMTSWAMIPCDSCSWCMFCSEKCKTEAWKQYHDLECTVHGCSIKSTIDDIECFKQTSIRLLILGVRKAGSIKNFKAELQTAEEEIKNSPKTFFENETYEKNGFKSLYSLCSVIESSIILEAHALNALFVLLSLAKDTTFFGKRLNNSECHKLITNEDALFIGSLILRLIKISHASNYKIHNASFYTQERFSSTHDMYLRKGLCIALFASIIQHNCDPNSSWCFTEDNKLIVYALKPMKKNTQIFRTYLSMFYDNPNPLRRDILKMEYGFICDCKSCKENWPPLMLTYADLIKRKPNTYDQIFQRPLEKKLFKNNKEIIELVKNDVNANYSPEMLLKLSNDVAKAVEILNQPSIITSQLIKTLEKLFDRLYGGRFFIPAQCKID